MGAYETYIQTLDQTGEAILSWADPDDKFGGYTKGWFLTDFPSAFNVALAYFLFVVVASQIMKSGFVPVIDAYPIKFVYNVSQIMLCAYMTMEAWFLAYRNNYHWLPCNDYNQTNPPIANLTWLFYVSKVWDFCDTVFIILGKRWRQLSFLHVYHHISIFLLCWFDCRVMYDGDMYLTIALNTFIHTVMYTYYFICMHTRVPETGKSLPIWWKSSLTMMQMIQFVTLMFQGGYVLSNQCTTSSPRVTLLYIVYILTLLVLFAHFFVESYIKPKKQKKQ